MDSAFATRLICAAPESDGSRQLQRSYLGSFNCLNELQSMTAAVHGSLTLTILAPLGSFALRLHSVKVAHALAGNRVSATLLASRKQSVTDCSIRSYRLVLFS